MDTQLQDCMQIASAFERIAHSTPTEAAAWATMSRMLTNTSSLSSATVSSLSSFIQTPQLTTATQAASIAGSKTPTVSATSSSATIDDLLSGINFGNTKSVISNQQMAGKLVSDWLRDCIPCSFRIQSFLELNPPSNLLAALDQHLKNQLAILFSMTDMLTRFNSATDLCSMIDGLSFICIPDLQRLIAILMAQFLLEVPKLDGLMDMLQKLIQPIFAPIFMAINALLSQFKQLIMNPVKCIIDSVATQTSKISPDAGASIYGASSAVTSASDSIQSELNGAASDMYSSFSSLMDTIETAMKTLDSKMDFYIDEVNGMLGEMSGGDASYLRNSMKKLNLIRQIVFVTSIIAAKAMGHQLCTNSSGKLPSKSTLDSFFDNFLNPRMPFTYRATENGGVEVEEKTGGIGDEVLSNGGNVVEFGDTIGGIGGSVDPNIAISVKEILMNLSVTTTSVPCRTKTDDATVSRWMTELGQ